MDWQSIVDRADQILEEERRFPTVSYYTQAPEPPSPTVDSTSAGMKILESLATGIAQIGSQQELRRMRAERPRPIVENTRRYRFQSANYDLLRALLSMLPEQSKLTLVLHVIARVVSPPECVSSQALDYPAWCGLTSELPLVAEFVIRNGGKESLIRILPELEPVTPHALMLRQLEEVISLEFTLFTYDEYEALSLSANLLGQSAARRSEEVMQIKVLRQRLSDLSLPCAPKAMTEIVSASQGIAEQCRKARYLYVRGELQEGLNLEINQDKDAVVSYLKQSGFSDPLIESLNEAERLYREQATGFDLKSSMGHLRSFLESLHAQAIPGICTLRKIVKPPADRWAAQLSFLSDTEILSKQENQLVSGLWAVISDEAVHPLMAEREYARLARNIVIEYAFLFLKKLEKLGFKGRGTLEVHKAGGG